MDGLAGWRREAGHSGWMRRKVIRSFRPPRLQSRHPDFLVLNIKVKMKIKSPGFTGAGQQWD
jgi:hypothetical protein